MDYWYVLDRHVFGKVNLYDFHVPYWQVKAGFKVNCLWRRSGCYFWMTVILTQWLFTWLYDCQQDWNILCLNILLLYLGYHPGKLLWIRYLSWNENIKKLHAFLSKAESDPYVKLPPSAAVFLFVFLVWWWGSSCRRSDVHFHRSFMLVGIFIYRGCYLHALDCCLIKCSDNMFPVYGGVLVTLY